VAKLYQKKGNRGHPDNYIKTSIDNNVNESTPSFFVIQRMKRRIRNCQKALVFSIVVIFNSWLFFTNSQGYKRVEKIIEKRLIH
jgi:hypothetical protein